MSTTSEQTFSIALAALSDCSECARLVVEQLGEHGIDASAERLARVLEDAVANPARGFLSRALISGRIVGVAYVATILSAEHCGSVAWLEELYVIPDHRSRGIGTALVSAVIEQARETGSVAVDLEIDADHSRVASLYQRLGFRPLQRSRWLKELSK
jgi:GNAT superfamily N-acetyltransferase